MGNRFNVRWLGSRIRHQMGPVAIRMYDKFNITINQKDPEYPHIWVLIGGNPHIWLLG